MESTASSAGSITVSVTSVNSPERSRPSRRAPPLDRRDSGEFFFADVEVAEDVLRVVVFVERVGQVEADFGVPMREVVSVEWPLLWRQENAGATFGASGQTR
jgi:hypothetical protein